MMCPEDGIVTAGMGNSSGMRFLLWHIHLTSSAGSPVLGSRGLPLCSGGKALGSRLWRGSDTPKAQHSLDMSIAEEPSTRAAHLACGTCGIQPPICVQERWGAVGQVDCKIPSCTMLAQLSRPNQRLQVTPAAIMQIAVVAD